MTSSPDAPDGNFEDEAQALRTLFPYHDIEHIKRVLEATMGSREEATILLLDTPIKMTPESTPGRSRSGSATLFSPKAYEVDSPASNAWAEPFETREDNAELEKILDPVQREKVRHLVRFCSGHSVEQVHAALKKHSWMADDAANALLDGSMSLFEEAETPLSPPRNSRVKEEGDDIEILEISSCPRAREYTSPSPPLKSVPKSGEGNDIEGLDAPANSMTPKVQGPLPASEDEDESLFVPSTPRPPCLILRPSPASSSTTPKLPTNSPVLDTVSNTTLMTTKKPDSYTASMLRAIFNDSSQSKPSQRRPKKACAPKTKICLACHESLEETTENFFKHANGMFGDYCLACRNSNEHWRGKQATVSKSYSGGSTISREALVDLTTKMDNGRLKQGSPTGLENDSNGSGAGTRTSSMANPGRGKKLGYGSSPRFPGFRPPKRPVKECSICHQAFYLPTEQSYNLSLRCWKNMCVRCRKHENGYKEPHVEKSEPLAKANWYNREENRQEFTTSTATLRNETTDDQINNSDEISLSSPDSSPEKRSHDEADNQLSSSYSDSDPDSPNISSGEEGEAPLFKGKASGASALFKNIQKPKTNHYNPMNLVNSGEWDGKFTEPSQSFATLAQKRRSDMGIEKAAKRHCSTFFTNSSTKPKDTGSDSCLEAAAVYIKKKFHEYDATNGIQVLLSSGPYPYYIPKQEFAEFKTLKGTVAHLSYSEALELPGANQETFELALQWARCRDIVMSNKSRTDQITAILALVEFAKEVGLDLMLTDDYKNRGILAMVKNILIKDQKTLEGQREPQYALTGQHIRTLYTLPTIPSLRDIVVKSCIRQYAKGPTATSGAYSKSIEAEFFLNDEFMKIKEFRVDVLEAFHKVYRKLEKNLRSGGRSKQKEVLTGFWMVDPLTGERFEL